MSAHRIALARLRQAVETYLRAGHGSAELHAVAVASEAAGRLLDVMYPAEISEHAYLSTGCLHGRHDYCQADTGAVGPKTPARCKFCDAWCVCPCHHQGAIDG